MLNFEHVLVLIGIGKFCHICSVPNMYVFSGQIGETIPSIITKNRVLMKESMKTPGLNDQSLGSRKCLFLILGLTRGR